MNFEWRKSVKWLQRYGSASLAAPPPPCTWKVFPWDDIMLQKELSWNSIMINKAKTFKMSGSLWSRVSPNCMQCRILWSCSSTSLITRGFPSQIASNPENASILWDHHDYMTYETICVHSYWQNIPQEGHTSSPAIMNKNYGSVQ